MEDHPTSDGTDLLHRILHEGRASVLASAAVLEMLAGRLSELPAGESRERGLNESALLVRSMRRLDGLLCCARCLAVPPVERSHAVRGVEIVERVAARVRPIVEGAGSTLELVMPACSPDVRLDPEYVVAIVGQLVEWSVEAAGVEGPVKLRLDDGEDVRLVVTRQLAGPATEGAEASQRLAVARLLAARIGATVEIGHAPELSASLGFSARA